MNSYDLTKFFDLQLNEWPLLRKNFDNLKFLNKKLFSEGGFQLVSLFNPHRITSSSAMVDPDSIRNRKCFLCAENLPPEQRHISYSGMMFLCNPYPVFPYHFTISSERHEPQSIMNGFEAFTGILNKIGDKYSLFYNGPECGASAPDHLHFQACPSGLVPLEKEVETYFSSLINTSAGRVLISNNYNRTALLIQSEYVDFVQKTFPKIMDILSGYVSGNSEPKINLWGFISKEQFNIAVFPRSFHRPKEFYFEEEKKLLISPAAIDMAGVLILPRQKEFEMLDYQKIKDIFCRISLNDSKKLRDEISSIL